MQVPLISRSVGLDRRERMQSRILVQVVSQGYEVWSEKGHICFQRSPDNKFVKQGEIKVPEGLIEALCGFIGPHEHLKHILQEIPQITDP